LPHLYLSPIFVAAGYFLGFSSLYKGGEVGECLFALSLGSMAADHTISARGVLDSGSDLTKRIMFAVAASLAIGALAIHLLLPFLISNVYEGESFAFLNGLISGQSERALEFYVSKGQRLGWSAMGIVAVPIVMALPFIVGRKGPVSETRITTQWQHRSAIPFILVGALLLGVLLTNIADRQAYFRERLYSAAEQHFVPLGLHRQSMSLVEYLGATSERSSVRLLVLKGFSLLNTDHPEDAVPVLRQALAIDLRAQADNRATATVLNRIASVYDELSDRESALRYWRESLSLIGERLKNADSDADRTDRHIEQALTYEAMGDLNNAIQAYLRARDITDSAKKMIEIEYGVRRLLRQCPAENGNMSPVIEGRIRVMLDTPKKLRKDLNLCR